VGLTEAVVTIAVPTTTSLDFQAGRDGALDDAGDLVCGGRAYNSSGGDGDIEVVRFYSIQLI
jgi:hypothetical protein